MPSTISWRGDAPAVAQVATITVAGTWATNDIANLIINGKIVTFTVGGTQTAAAVVTGLVAAWNASLVAEHAEVTAADGAGDTITLTADTAGVPFTVTTSETTVGDGALSGAATVVSSGPKDASTLANWSGGALPGNGDTVVFENSSADCLYGLEALTAVTGAIIKRSMTHTGKVGLPSWNANGYVEYRPRFFKIGFASADLGSGEGPGSGRFMLDGAAAASE